MSFNHYEIIDFSKYKLDEKHRASIILSIIGFYDKLQLESTEAFCITVNLFDRYIINCNKLQENLNYIICACISLSIKTIDDAGYSNLVSYSFRYFNLSPKTNIIPLELYLLKLFHWRVHPIYTVYNVLEDWSCDNKKIQQLEKLEIYIIISQLLFIKADPKILAQSILTCNNSTKYRN